MLALGTNDAANVSADSSVGSLERIEKMMSTIGDEPVMWVNVKSLVRKRALRRGKHEEVGRSATRSLSRYPNMRDL